MRDRAAPAGGGVGVLDCGGDAMSKESLFDELSEEFTGIVDSRTLRDGMSKRDAAELYRDLAGEFRMRAEGLEDEADNDDDRSEA